MDANPQHEESHPLSEKQTNTDDHKLSTAIAAVADPKFPLPQLTSSSGVIRYILSFGTLLALLGGGIAGAYYLGVEMLQSSQPVVASGVILGAVLGMLFLTGTVWVDWFELVIGYWWLSMPVGALAGLVVVLNQEGASTLVEHD